jgi:hypothetical protein
MSGVPVQEWRDHVTRSMLPWRSEALTECGCATSDVANVITLNELDDRIMRYREERTCRTVCTRCWQTSNISPRWETNHVGVIAREAVRSGIGDRHPSSQPEAVRFGNELRAIAALIDAHRGEFDSYLAGLESTVSITDRGRRRPVTNGTEQPTGPTNYLDKQLRKEQR